MVNEWIRYTCFIGTLGLASSCSSSLSSGGGVCHAVTQATLFGQSCPTPFAWGWGGDGLRENQYFGAFVSLLRVRAEVTITKPLSQNREISICFPLSSPCHTISVFVCAVKTADSWVVHPTAVLPALDSRSRCISVLCASKIHSHPQFACTPLQLEVSVWGLP